MSVFDRVVAPLTKQANVESVTTDASGYATITLPAAFPDTNYAPTVNVYTTAGNWATVTARTTTTFTIRLFTSAGTLNSTARTVTWSAERY